MNKHHSRKLQTAFNQYGESAFRVEVLSEESTNLNDLEKSFIAQFDSWKNGYNMNEGGQHGQVYYKTWTGLVDPNGNRLGPIDNLASFCRLHGLNAKAMRQMFAGIRFSHRGYTLEGTAPKTGFTWPKGKHKSNETRQKIASSVARNWKARKQKQD